MTEDAWLLFNAVVAVLSGIGLLCFAVTWLAEYLARFDNEDINP